jgi:hypothetical protein
VGSIGFVNAPPEATACIAGFEVKTGATVSRRDFTRFGGLRRLIGDVRTADATVI